MSFETKLGDEFLKVPKLTADGTNWVTYKDRLLWSVEARGLGGHLDGSETEPEDPKLLSAEMKTWRMGEAVVKQQVAGTLPNTLFTQIKQLKTSHEIFNHLAKLFEQRSRVVAVEILRKMQNLRC
ncbi:hypothetical protein PISMIDRAFT_101446 [Pisolithus microcarpus 441]|uniref:Unplaced genomic scaffold scaffold_48, whole genome shotgun sequence n=1 Tax=Pisolithus microcarpus 441 TaxID=765257 RepID=A0A0C9ZKT8_9AGAM|nr:hypothetical protein PISMIDRAFT_101446 [Pisolithus microcarpus 441]